MSKEKIKDEALKQLFKLKLEQLNSVRTTYNFSNPIAFETIWLFSHKFDDMYKDAKMLSILHDSYAEFQTIESRTKLVEGLKEWANDKGYDYDMVFN